MDTEESRSIYLLNLIARIKAGSGLPNNDPAGDAAWHAMREAERLTDRELGPILCRFLDEWSGSERASDRSEALFVLIRLGHSTRDASLLEAAIERLAKEPDIGVVSHALNLIRPSSDPPMTVRNARLVIPVLKKGRNYFIRSGAMEVLGMDATGSTEITGALVAHLGRAKSSGDDKAACEALSKVGTRRTAPEIIAACERMKNPDKWLALRALSRVEGPAAQDYYVEQLEKLRDRAAQIVVLMAIEKHVDTRAVPAVVRWVTADFKKNRPLDTFEDPADPAPAMVFALRYLLRFADVPLASETLRVVAGPRYGKLRQTEQRYVDANLGAFKPV